MDRRDFLKGIFTTGAFTLLDPMKLFSQNTDSPIRVGFIGCGDRGMGVISQMSRSSNVKIVAIADLFRDKIDAVLGQLNQLNADKKLGQILERNIYVGDKAYVKLLRNKEVDAVLISTPTYAHPFIFEAAVNAGKHVYCEKPAAPDVYGANIIAESAKDVNNQSLVMGFQIRYASAYAELVRRIHNGDIGDIVSVQLYYNSSFVPRKEKDGASKDEFRIRNHFHFLDMSGGILCDQGIHMLDVCNWALKSTPLYAIGMGGNKGAEDFGDTLTNYSVVYKYPNDINVSIQSTQVGKIFGDVCARFIGTKGVAEAHYDGGVFIKGDNPWDSGVKNSLMDSDSNKSKSFIDSIISKKYINQIEDGCNSTLTAILGRQTVIENRKITWDELLMSDQRYNINIDLSKFK